jgi:hypothetical protein
MAQRWSFLKSIIKPKWIQDEVNIIHMALMRKNDEELRKSREEQAVKPKLVKPIEVFR